MKYLQIIPSAAVLVPIPNIGSLNTFLDVNDYVLKTVDSNGAISLLIDSNLTSDLQQTSDSNANTTEKITVDNLKLTDIKPFENNTSANLKISQNLTYRLPMQSVNSYHPVGISKLKTSWDLSVSMLDFDLNLQLDYEGLIHMVIDWGDGFSNTINSGYNISHDYASAGNYTIKIYGSFNPNYINNMQCNYLSLSNMMYRLTAISPIYNVSGLRGISFSDCTSLTSLPIGLFSETPYISSFNSMFAYCGNLITLPADLFSYTPQCTNFDNAFQSCGSLLELPAGLFDKNVNAISFDWAFKDCAFLTTIPAGLFDKNVNATSFELTFSDCTSLTTIPAGLFDYNPKGTRFGYTFMNDSNITSAVPTLWLTHPNTNHLQCFGGVTSASNYDDIPANWK